MFQMRTMIILLTLTFLVLGGLAPVLAQEIRPTPTTVPIAQETPRPTDTPIPQETPIPGETPQATATAVSPTATVTSPTATPITPVTTPEPGQSESGASLQGSIQGAVYEDTNGDGACGGTGDNPVAGVTIQFVSSDEKTVINLTSGADGTFGLTAAGLSYWSVTVKPSADWVVTSAATQYAPVFENSLNITGLTYCVQKASAARVLLPASGGAVPSSWVMVVGLLGCLLVTVGLGLQVRKQ